MPSFGKELDAMLQGRVPFVMVTSWWSGGVYTVEMPPTALEDSIAIIKGYPLGTTGSSPQVTWSGGSLSIPYGLVSILVKKGTAWFLAGCATPDSTVSSNAILGTTTNDSAAAGYLGQTVESTIAVGSAVSLTTATPTNVTSISLTAGDWDVSGAVANVLTGANLSTLKGGTSSTSATFDGVGSFNNHPFTGSITGDFASTIPTFQYKLSGTTTVYLIAQATFSSGTVTAYGRLFARRAR